MRYKIFNADVYSALLNIDDNSVDVAVTSPPYWGQRDYGFSGQIGNESNYIEYIEKLITIFDLLKNKLKNNGVFFLNVGDKYTNKYGKNPLNLIPYQLAYFMKNQGWVLNEIIIWYKPNHMPSSIKNRFTSSYEPVFVFSKTNNNIYLSAIEKKEKYSNILKVPLQPTPFKHVAVYPEKLVYELLKKVNLPEDATILDPFAGSGTTLKVVKDHFPDANAIMIEYNKNYIEIIKERCKLNGEADILNLDFVTYSSKKIHKAEKENLLFDNSFAYLDTNNKNGFVKIFENKEKYYSMLKSFRDNTIKLEFNRNATFFLGCKDFDIELIYDTSQLNECGWIIRNMIVIENNLRWFPVFMIVDDNKKEDYIFNYKKLKLRSKNNNSRNWFIDNFVGYKVINKLSKVNKEGKVVKTLERYENGFPKYVVVEWNNSEFTKEFVIYSDDNINQNLTIIKNNFELIISERQEIVPLNKNIEFNINLIETSNDKLFEIPSSNNYNGKFKDEKRINFGASPGARASLNAEYFSLQRLYEVDQKLVAEYLNKKRISKGLSKQDLINLFPPSYKHTVGHWLRNDFGGSLPLLEDWFKLVNILDIDQSITNYVCKTALRLQTVKNAEYKVPDDFQNIDFLDKFNLLITS